ncbi:MAG: M20/M25/M40 family metallo-hydrolase [Thermodesulfovibrionales bacterium]|nr:M20/M25/M40 family metallo-hydrolase [Thermodesulfovibrionales bacterium]
MKIILRVLFILIFQIPLLGLSSCLRSESTYADTYCHHELHVKIIPERHYIVASDTITFEEPRKRLSFFINKNLDIKKTTPEASVEIKETAEAKLIEIIFDSPRSSITLTYEGLINEPVRTIGEQARGYSYTGGIISEEGIFLHGGSYWYPVSKGLLTFRLAVELPQGWYGISQGEEKKGDTVIWDSPEPQEEIYLVANRFIKYEEELDGISAMVLLRSPDDEIAKKYISATFRYIKLYEELIGPYPYKKFALVENFFESGFGMPSFTLLGPKVLRLPFIIDTSYPHEILHNWWGNSVWPRPGRGNWTEGLTAYLSDHLMKELKGEDREYRFTTLQKYADYVLDEKDFPIEEFRSRHSGATEAIGYGKSLFFFHMLRRSLGEKLFKEGLRDFYQEKKFRYADLDDLRRSFERVSGRDLRDFFDQWTKRTGAPVIEIKEAVVKESHLRLTLRQSQDGSPYILEIPVRIILRNGTIHETALKMRDKNQSFMERLPEKPLRIDIDPDLHVFRKLSRDEIPPAITAVLGSKEIVIIKPEAGKKELMDTWDDVTRVIENAGPERIKVVIDSKIDTLPESSIIILGWENKFLDYLFSDQKYIKIENNGYRLSERLLDTEKDSVVIVRNNPLKRDRPLMFIGSKNPSTLRALLRKLPHYHKYSYLVFEGEEATNTMKGRWEIEETPMNIILDEKSRSLSIKSSDKLLIPFFSQESINKTLEFLTSPHLEGRKAGSDGAMRAAEFIRESFRKAGLQPLNSDYLQKWHDEKGMTFANVIGKIKGRSEECIIIGAHYDHLGKDDKGNIYPGADDNASGVALLLELARIKAEKGGINRDLIFIAFTGEEYGRKGSRHFVEHADSYRCIAMINLDTVGRLEGRRLLVIGAHSAKEWPMLLKEASLISGIKIDIAKEDLDSSDQKSFEEAGIPAIQLSSGPHEDYHKITDTIDKVDIDGIIKIGTFTEELIKRVDRLPELSFTGNINKRTSQEESKRRVSIGTIPDFTYKGTGYRISGTTKGSPAHEAGLREGDVIIEVSSKPVKGIRDFSEYLKNLQPGDKILLKIERDGKTLNIEVELRERK